MMLVLQILFTATVAVVADSFYLKVWLGEHHSPQFAPAYLIPIIGDPYLFVLAISTSLWFACAVCLLQGRKWAYFGCVVPHVLICLGSGIAFYDGLQAIKGEGFGLFFGMPLIVSGIFLGWLITNYNKLLHTTPHHKV